MPQRDNVIVFEEDMNDVQITKSENGTLDITIHNPWYGDSESGFGATLSISLSKEQTDELRSWLVR